MGSGVSMPILAYRDFYDVPRAFVVEPRPGPLLFFDCPFDEGIDEYPTFFRVYALSINTVEALPNDWRDLATTCGAQLGVISLTDLSFDPTRRLRVEVEGIARLLGQKNAKGLAD